MNSEALILHDDWRLTVWCIEIPSDVDRREAEKNAERELIWAAFGRNAELGHNAVGAPYVIGAQSRHISISHSHTHCVLVVSKGGAVGIDIENQRTQLIRVKDRFLTERERGCMKKEEALSELLRLWTAKEAVYKAALTPGLGLTEIEVDFEEMRATARRMKFELITPEAPPDAFITVALCIS